MIKFNNILVPTDFSVGSAAALATAKEFAKSLGSKLHILNVIHSPVYSIGIEFVSLNYTELIKELEENASKMMKEISNELETENIPHQMNVCGGNPSSEIVNYAKDNNIDLIVIATHGSSGFDHLLFGSTTEKVLRKAVCPILVVKFPKQVEK